MKYELTDQTIAYYDPCTEFSGEINCVEDIDNIKKIEYRTLYRVRALKDFGKIKAGDLGGYIESTDNLSQDGSCWIADTAKVFGWAEVSGDAIVSENALVHDWAKVSNKARVSGGAEIYGYARIFGKAKICGAAAVAEWAAVGDDAQVFGSAYIRGHAEIRGNTQVRGDAEISDWKYTHGTLE